jgi:RNA polymerase sigma-70 factor (ECF subfamily)
MQTQEERLIHLAKTGDEHGVVGLYQIYFEPIYRFCYWQTNRSEDAEDLTQDIFIEMAKSIGNFRGEASFKNWLYVIAKRRVSKWIKQKYNQATVALFESISASEIWIDDENQLFKTKVVQKLLDKLSDKERVVMSLRFLQNLNIKEVAARLHLTEANVKVITHRSLAKLQQSAKNPLEATKL